MDKLKHNSGFSTIELMIALTIMTLVMTAVILVSFGNQSFLSGSQTNAEAMKIAQGVIEEQQARARKDFNLVNPIEEADEDIYKKSSEVKLLSDFLTKEVKALVTWKDERGADRKLELTTLIANFDTPVGGNICDSTLSGDWTLPSVENTVTDFATLVGDPGGTYTISDVDAYQNYLYVTANSVSGGANPPTPQQKPTFFVFDISDPEVPVVKGSIDNENASGTTSAGLNAVRVSKDPATNKTYAFVANAHNANYTTCNPTTTTNCGQLEVIDVTNPANPTWKANFKVVSSPAVTGTSRGLSISFKNGYLLLGLSSSASGPELHMIDVHNIAMLFGVRTITPVGSYEVGHDVNSLSLRGTYVYITIPQDALAKELQILDITNPSLPESVGGFDVSGGGNGKSSYLVGNRIYFGNTAPSTGYDMHVLDNTNPETVLPEIAGVNFTSSVNAMIARSNLLFALSNNNLQVFNIGDPDSVSNFTIGGSVASLTLPNVTVPVSATEPSMDCEGNRLYITSNNGTTGKGALYIIKPN